MSAFDDFVSAVEAATGRPGRRQGRNVRLLCPGHDDRNPSLDVAEGEDGRPLVQCRSQGCSFEQIARAVGWDPEPTLDTQDEWTPHGTAIAVYDYGDEEGQLLFQVCRTADKQFPQRRPDSTSKSGWRWSTKGVRMVPYRLRELLTAVSEGYHIFVCEGEKDVEAIRKAGGVASCNPGGAGKWRAEYAQHFAGAFHVTIIADSDPAGIAHARAVEASLHAANGTQPQIIEVVLPGAGKDASDHFAAGLSLDAFIAFQPEEASDRAPVGVTLHEFLAIEFNAPPPFLGSAEDTVIPAGGFCLLAGMPGAGKTTLAVDLAFHLASGEDWLEMPVERPLNVLLVENEGPQHKFQEKLARKLEHWQAALEGAIFIQTWKWGQFSFREPEHAEAARAFLDQQRVDVVIGDPLDTLGVTGVGSPEETREFLALLVPLGLTETRTFVFLHHFRKEITPSELNMVSGSWGGRLDTLLVLKETERDDELRLSYPKVRWGTQHPERRPLILGKVQRTLGFARLAEEVHEASDDTAAEGTLGRIIDVLRAAGTALERSVLVLRAEPPSERSFKRALGLGLDRGLLAKGQHGRKAIFSLTEESWDEA